MPPPKLKLGEMLIQAGLIDQNQLMHALERQKMWGGKLGSCMVYLGFVKEEQLMTFLSQKLMIPSVNLSSCQVSPEAIKTLTLEQAEKYCVLPLALEGKSLSLAMADPTDLPAISELQFVTGKTVKTFVALENSIKDAINRYYRAVEAPASVEMPAFTPIEVVKTSTEMVLTHIDTSAAKAPPPAAPPYSPPMVAPPVGAPPPAPEAKRKAPAFPTDAVLRATVKLLIRKGIITYEELKEEVKKEEGH